MKLMEILNLSQNLKAFVDKGKELPYTVARALSKNYTLVADEVKIFEEQRKNIIGDKDYDNLTDEEKNDLNAKFTDLLETEVNIDFIKYDESVLEKCNADLSVKDMILLEYFIAEKEN